ncbi:MAG: hypothetical protein U1F43_13240 [Myxococcota bacterium]
MNPWLRRSVSFASCLATALALVAGAVGPASAKVRVDVAIGGGTVVDFAHSGETGNAFGGSALVGLDDFSVGLGVATCLPDSRTQGQFTAYWAEGRWYALGRDMLLQPYLVIGFGGATADGFVPGSLDFEPARWSSGAGPVGMLGVGARYGLDRGAFLAVDVRAWNVGHLGFALSAGYTF